jgi:hypothetical protein
MDLRYPIGRYQPQSTLSEDERRRAIEDIADMPGWLS